MPDYTATALPGGAVAACPSCGSRSSEGDIFCARCGVFLHGPQDGLGAVNLPIVHLLTEVATLQRELLHELRKGQASQARQFQRALQLQADQLEKTLTYGTRQTEAVEQRAQLWQKCAAGLAAAVFVLVLLAVQLA